MVPNLAEEEEEEEEKVSTRKLANWVLFLILKSRLNFVIRVSKGPNLSPFDTY